MLVAITEIRRIARKLHDGCLCTMHWPTVLLKLKLVSISENIKNMEYTDDKNFIDV